MSKYVDLKKCLIEDLEWAEANEFEVPLTLILDLKAVIELLDELEIQIKREE